MIVCSLRVQLLLLLYKKLWLVQIVHSTWNQQLPPCKGKEQQDPQAAYREGVVKSRGLSAEQRKALELLGEKCPISQRDGGYDQCTDYMLALRKHIASVSTIMWEGSSSMALRFRWPNGCSIILSIDFVPIFDGFQCCGNSWCSTVDGFGAECCVSDCAYTYSQLSAWSISHYVSPESWWI